MSPSACHLLARRSRPLLNRIILFNRRTQSTSASPGTGTDAPGASLEPPPAGGHLPSVATSRLLRSTRDSALRTPGLKWSDEDDASPAREIVGGRETRKMNMYQAVRDALRYAEVPPTRY